MQAIDYFTSRKKLLAKLDEQHQLLMEQHSIIAGLHKAVAAVGEKNDSMQLAHVQNMASLLSSVGGETTIARELYDSVCDFRGSINIDVEEVGNAINLKLVMTPCEEESEDDE